MIDVDGEVLAGTAEGSTVLILRKQRECEIIEIKANNGKTILGYAKPNNNIKQDSMGFFYVLFWLGSLFLVWCLKWDAKAPMVKVFFDTRIR